MEANYLNGLAMALSNHWLNATLDQIALRTGVPGICAELSVGGARISAAVGKAEVGGDHPISSEDLFEVSCLSKVLSSLAAIKLAASGDLDLDAPLRNYIAELRSDRGITIRHLMTHTSGYRGLDLSDAQVRWGLSWPKFAEYLGTVQQLFYPGTVFNYEHSEHVILGEIVKRVKGVSMPDFIARELLDPLGLKFSTAPEACRSSGAIVTNHAQVPGTRTFRKLQAPPLSPFWESSLSRQLVSLANVVAIGEALVQDNPCIAPPTIKAAIIKDVVHLPSLVRSHPMAEHTPVAFGLVLSRLASGAIGHNGSGTGQTFGLRINFPERVVVVVGINAWHPFARDEVIRRIFRSLGLFPNPKLERRSQTPFALEDFAGPFCLDELPGTYIGSAFKQVRVTANGNVLSCEVGRTKDRTFTIVGDGEGRYTIKSPYPIGIGFFPDPISGKPSLSMGVHSYAKVA
jgi:CubicO group peptidase (beta-lactamase class C family)